MNRYSRVAVALTAAALCAGAELGCGSDTPSFKGKGDGSAGASGSAGTDAAGTGGASSGDGSGTCGNVFGRTAACNTCLAKNCCDAGDACRGVTECPKLAQCLRDCDSKVADAGARCRTSCDTQFLTSTSRTVYNALIQCMGQSCLSECPFQSP